MYGGDCGGGMGGRVELCISGEAGLGGRLRSGGEAVAMRNPPPPPIF